MANRTLIALAFLVLVPASVHAAVSKASQDFVTAAGTAGTYEVAAGELATQRATSPDVKTFGRLMVTDHTKANAMLKAIAGSIPVPDTLDAKHAKLLAELEAAPSAEFDATYLKQQRQAHEEAVALFKKESAEGDDPALKSFAESTLPTLEKHLEMVQALEKGAAK